MHVRFKYEDFSTAAGVACDERTTRWESRWLSAKPGRGPGGGIHPVDIFALVHQKTIEPLGTNAPAVWFGGNSLLPVEASSMLKSRQTNRAN